MHISYHSQQHVALAFVHALMERGVTYESLGWADEACLDNIAELLGSDHGHDAAWRARHTPVETIAFSDRRVADILIAEGIVYLQDLASKTDRDILKIKGIGPLSLELIKDILYDHDITLRTAVVRTRVEG